MARYVSNKILIELLKKYGIKKLVLSSGMRNIPFVSEVEIDSFFECYSVVDERNAAFYALGLSQGNGNEPVAIACTSGTAASNYLTGISEAYYSHAPIVVITFDRPENLLNQLETQKVNQPAIFQSVTKKSVSLPMIKDKDDIWYCNRLINEALISLNQYQTGPVHINVPLAGGTNTLNEADITKIEAYKIDYYSIHNYDAWEKLFEKINNSNRVLFIMGQHLPFNHEEKKILVDFFNEYQIPILADNISNFSCLTRIMPEALMKAMDSCTIKPLIPDIVVTIGNNFQERIKDLFRANAGSFEHWGIEPNGVVKDVFKSQRVLIDATEMEFIKYLVHKVGEKIINNKKSYFKLWKKYEECLSLPALPWGNMLVAKKFSSVIPKESLLHLAILNSTRVHQFFELDESIKVFSNVNTFGIDGCLPTFIGQSACTKNLSFLVIGDLSFFYAMNAVAIKHVSKNVRIMVINNKGAAEFHIPPESHNRPMVDVHIGCEHSRSVKGWVTSIGFEYLQATNEKSLEKALGTFVSSDGESPIILEVFTDKKKDGPNMIKIYRHLEKCLKDFLKNEVNENA